MTNTIIVGGEVLDGFSVVEVPQITYDPDKFDEAALDESAGIRAVWYLYTTGQWSKLIHLGIDQSIAPKLKRYRFGRPKKDGSPPNRLTKNQVNQLRKVNEIVYASEVLRLAYLFKMQAHPTVTNADRSNTVVFHADVPSNQAEGIKTRHTPEIAAMGGEITIGYGTTGGMAIIEVKLPDTPKIDPSKLLPQSGLKFRIVHGQQVKIPKEINDGK